MTNLVLFDLDHTLIPTDSDYEWGCFAARLGLVDTAHFTRESERFYADYQAGQLDIYAYLRSTLAPLARYPRAQLAAWRTQFMQEVITPALRPSIMIQLLSIRVRLMAFQVIAKEKSSVPKLGYSRLIKIGRALNKAIFIAIHTTTSRCSKKSAFLSRLPQMTNCVLMHSQKAGVF